MEAEVVGCLMVHSLALVGGTRHVLADVFAVGLALFASWRSRCPASTNRTLGFHRTEILSGLFNALSLWLIVRVLFQSYRRFLRPPEVQGLIMIGVGPVPGCYTAALGEI